MTRMVTEMIVSVGATAIAGAEVWVIALVVVGLLLFRVGTGLPTE